MEYNESNFTYLKGTSLSEYYKELVKAECACDDYPAMTKMTVRKVLEAFIRKIGISYGISSNIPTGSMVRILKKNSELELTEEIYDFIQIIRVNGIGITLYRSKNKIIEKHPIEVLELIHKIFLWYLEKTEKKTIDEFSDLSFRAPKSILFEENELKKVKRDILLKDNQINNLREKIIEIADKSRSVGELAKIIIAIKKEKSNMEVYKSFLINTINLHKHAVERIRNEYEIEIKDLDSVREDCVENHRLLSKKEGLLVRAELDNQKIKAMIHELEEDDEIITEKESILANKLETIRYIYEESVNLTNRYQDNIETVEFTHDEELKKILNADRIEINTELNYHDTCFYNEINEYSKCVDELKKKILLFKEIINDKIRQSIKYNDFFNAFANLNGNKLRILYSMVSNWKKNNHNILSNPKEWLFNINNEESFIDMINNTLEELRDISDDEVKLLLYYKLIKISNKKAKNIFNRKNFIKVIDGIVDDAYRVIVDNKDFNYYLSKTHSIEVYYLKRIIDKLKNRYKNIKINDDLLSKIYDEIVKLSLKNEVYFSESLKMNVENEHSLRAAIKKQPFEFLSIIIEIGEAADYKIVYSMIFEILKGAVANKNHEVSSEQISLEKFLRGHFRIMLFISDGEGLNNKYADEILPIFVGELLVTNSLGISNEVSFDSYNGMIEVLKEKCLLYKDKINEKELSDMQLEGILRDRVELEESLNELLHKKELLNQKYASYEYEFKQIVLSSDKIKKLNSYEKYKEYENKRYQSDADSEEINEISIIGTFVEQASKKINDSNFVQIESNLIEEAKNSSFFDKEFMLFKDMQNKLGEIACDIQNNRKLIDENEKVLYSVKSRVENIQEYLEVLKGIYPDVQ